MGIIRGILEDELKRLEELSVFYQKKISEYPRGSISVKERNGKRYIYLARREDKKVVFDYIGKDAPAVWAALNEKLKQRKEYQAKLCQVKENLREVERSLRGKRT
ncbi:MAG: hypothetical protein LLG40_08345 [Deltaproteobacteria bacterium]|nr:hypothetical protein [Deltaproteobacteria bacterium]